MTEAELWARWEAGSVQVNFIDLHDGQKRVFEERKRFNVLACGRRWGKTRFGVYLALKELAKGKLVGWFAPNYRYADEAFEELIESLGGRDGPSVQSVNSQLKTVRLKNGGVFECWTLENEDAGRSRKYHLVIVDEAAQVRKLRGIWNKAIRPTLADFEGDAWLLSTPRGSTGFFFEKFTEGQAGEGGWGSWQMPTSTNPYILQSEIDEAESNSIPTVFNQEWLARFIQPAGAVYDCFTHANNVVHKFRIPKDWRLYGGWDFGSANTAGVVVAYDEAKDVYYIAFGYHGAGESASKHIREIEKVLNGRRFRACYGGANSEDSHRDAFTDAGMRVDRPIVSGTGSVEVGINTVYKLLKDGRLKIFSDQVNLITQFLSYSYKVDNEDRVTDLIEDKAMYHLLDAVRYVMVSIADAVTPRVVGGNFDKAARI